MGFQESYYEYFSTFIFGNFFFGYHTNICDIN